MQINPSDPFNWDFDSRAMIEKECCKKRIKFDRPSLVQLFEQRLSSLQCRRCSLWEKPLSPAPAAKEPAGQHKAGVLRKSRKAVRKSNLRALHPVAPLQPLGKDHHSIQLCDLDSPSNYLSCKSLKLNLDVNVGIVSRSRRRKNIG